MHLPSIDLFILQVTNRGFVRDVTNCILPEVGHLGGHGRKKWSLLAVLFAAVTMVDGTEEFLSTIYRQF